MPHASWGGPGVPPAGLVTVKASRSRAAIPVRKEIAPLVQFGLDEVERRGYLYDHGPKDVNDDWGYVKRYIAGTRVWSNHSWGLAFDLDAQEYPQGQRKSRPPRWIDDIWALLGFENGAPWNYPDPMHYEFFGSRAEATWRVAALAAHWLEKTEPVLEVPRIDAGHGHTIPTNRPVLGIATSSGRFVEIAQWELARATGAWFPSNEIGVYWGYLKDAVAKLGRIMGRPDWDGNAIDAEVWAAIDLSYIKAGHDRGEEWDPIVA